MVRLVPPFVFVHRSAPTIEAVGFGCCLSVLPPNVASGPYFALQRASSQVIFDTLLTTS